MKHDSFADIWAEEDKFYNSLHFWEGMFKKPSAARKRECLKQRIKFDILRTGRLEMAQRIGCELELKKHLYNDMENIND